MVELTERERISLLMMRGWGDQERDYKAVQRLFNEHFRGRNNRISKTTVMRTIQRFNDTDSVKDLQDMEDLRRQQMKINHWKFCRHLLKILILPSIMFLRNMKSASDLLIKF